MGFVLLGYALGTGQPGLALFVVGAVVMAAFVLTQVLVREPRQPGPIPTRPVALVRAFRLDLRQHRAFVWVVLSRFCFLLGTYAVGRFLLLFVANRLGLEADLAARQAGVLLAALTLLTAAAGLPAGWLVDRLGHRPLMLFGAGCSALGALLLTSASSPPQILLYGGMMALGSAAFASANWALATSLAPPHEAARFIGLLNVGTAGGAAVAGLFGPVVDWANHLNPGTGYSALFVAASLAFGASALALRGLGTPSAREAHTE
jgi:MFS family permease